MYFNLKCLKIGFKISPILIIQEDCELLKKGEIIDLQL